jgi:hypothetical protein
MEVTAHDASHYHTDSHDGNNDTRCLPFCGSYGTTCFLFPPCLLHLDDNIATATPTTTPTAGPPNTPTAGPTATPTATPTAGPPTDCWSHGFAYRDTDGLAHDYAYRDADGHGYAHRDADGHGYVYRYADGLAHG